MTSYPASRRARATTFTPRSWPSSPTFATMIRIGRTAVELIRPLARCRCRRPRSGVHDLAFGGIGANRFEDVRHQVVRTGRRLTQLGERVRAPCLVALPAHLADPRDLLSLELGVDP